MLVGELNPLGCRELGRLGTQRFEMQSDSSKEAPVIRRVRCQELREGFGFGTVQIVQRGGGHVGGLAAGKTLVIGSRSDEQEDFVSLVHPQSVGAGREAASPLEQAHPRGILEPVAVRAVVELTGHEQLVGSNDHGVKTFGTVEPQVEGNLRWAAGAQAQHQHFIGLAGKQLAREGDAAARKAQPGHGVIEVQFPAVVLDVAIGVPFKC